MDPLRQAWSLADNELPPVLDWTRIYGPGLNSSTHRDRLPLPLLIFTLRLWCASIGKQGFNWHEPTVILRHVTKQTFWAALMVQTNHNNQALTKSVLRFSSTLPRVDKILFYVTCLILCNHRASVGTEVYLSGLPSESGWCRYKI